MDRRLSTLLDRVLSSLERLDLPTPGGHAMKGQLEQRILALRAHPFIREVMVAN